MIEIRNVDLTLQKTEILKNISVHFERGKIHGLIGRNGSGKTMLMKFTCGFVLCADTGKSMRSNDPYGR